MGTASIPSIMQFCFSASVLIVSYISTTSAMVPRLQQTVIGEVKSLYRNPISSSTESSLSKQVMCSSYQCKLCLGSCEQCNSCGTCLRICRGRTGGFCSKCSCCSGGAEQCRSWCRAEQNSQQCG